MLRFVINLLPSNSVLKRYYTSRRRLKNIQSKSKRIPEYLKDNDFEIELNYKLWVTKGARFEASERCEELDARYNRIVGWVSSYLIIFNVLTLCEIPFLALPANYSTFISISLSILILTFSQFAYAKNYSVHAKNYHKCALEISKLYDRLRVLKSKKRCNDSDFEEIDKIRVEYEKTLDGYENHLPIDFKMFKLRKKEYFHVSVMSALLCNIKYFMLVRFVYYFCVYGLPIIYVIICVLYYQLRDCLCV